MLKPLVSIIIPYYNGGAFVEQTLSSAISQTYNNIEIIIVDDGSRDTISIDVFDKIEHTKVKKYRTINQGLAMARNTAISMASGEIILPLDCDDLISNSYIEEAVSEFARDNDVGIVYSHACFFGLVNQYWDLPEFKMPDFLVNNCIFSAALFRREDWIRVGGYKSDMKHGLEDYDFWLSLVGLGRKVMRLPDVHFFYRKHGSSMISQITADQMGCMYRNIIERHKDLYHKNILNLIFTINSLQKFLNSNEIDE